ncbi:hypothetical protein FisN_1Lu663 [Fistulifera solaris]|uniref:Uncharacterized protein n=1 Tax=Fistulifera solaris TaxID=1519565 RepID=A0A1Z5K0N6_FISSO|nr:hypothetical protein FisN_1Lu663 [Fistulifera solaris]|eukprot:GAX19873.1 hypothetical protein FisN_1Lu663 [Fistulifera solaris]
MSIANNSRLTNINKDKEKYYELSTLEIIPWYFSSGKHNWWKHPLFDHILVSEDGTHIIDTRRGKYIPIKKRISLINGVISFRITFVDQQKVARTRDFCCFVLEAHIGKVLDSNLTCDHADQDGVNNWVGNLLPRDILHQANNKRIYRKVRKDGSVVGVFRATKDLKVHSYWVALAREYIRKGATRSKEKSKKFSTKTFGENSAKQMAIDWRTTHVSFKLSYDVKIVDPEVRKTFE